MPVESSTQAQATIDVLKGPKAAIRPRPRAQSEVTHRYAGPICLFQVPGRTDASKCCR